uniref:Thioesterase superfamily protein n=1 Tax=Caulobacter sp. (strain K31) TaxID=366602 RepID=B0T613_CAUSK
MSRVFVPPGDAFKLTFEPKASEIDANGHVNNCTAY